jgi:hypothetical protein
MLRIANGKISEHWGNDDDLGLMRQLGVVPEMSPSPARVTLQPSAKTAIMARIRPRFFDMIPHMIDAISLDTHWRCDTLDGDPDERIDGFAVPSLLAFDLRRVSGKTAWLEKSFDLPLQDLCINYVLEVEAAPFETRLYVNGRDFGVLLAPVRVDVTDTVALEDNVIALRVVSGARSAFGSFRLIAIPCK